MTRHARKTRWSVLLATVFGICLGGHAAAQPAASGDTANLHSAADALKNTVDVFVDYSRQSGNVRSGAPALGGLAPDVARSVIDGQVDRFISEVRKLEIPMFDSELRKLLRLELIAKSQTVRRDASRGMPTGIPSRIRTSVS